MVEEPILSIVIASVNGLPMLEDCLTALHDQRGDVSAEIIVMDVTGMDTVSRMQRAFPAVVVETFTTRRTIPELRTAGLMRSRGEIVAVLEDHCNVDEHWCENIVNAHREHPECVAVGGAVENGRCDRLVDWAVFFCEYSSYMLPLTGGVAEDIPGSNASYKRRAFDGIEQLDRVLTAGFWESTLHPLLLKRGDRFFLDPSIVVYHAKEFGFRYFISQRFHYSRYYAGTLFGRAGLATRMLRGVGSLVLPPLLMYRIAIQVREKGRHVRELILSAPLLAVFLIAWAVGESVGSILGPGRSLRAVE